MHSKVFTVTAALAFLCAFGTHDRLSAQQGSPPTSVVDPKTGELVATNYRSEGEVVIVPSTGKMQTITSSLGQQLPQEPPEPEPWEPTECDPIYDYGCQPCPTNNPVSWCYQPVCTPTISSYVEYRTGDEPNGPLDVFGSTQTSCGYLVLTGVGGRIDGHDNYTTLHLRGRRINPDGTWGETVTYRFGTEPNHDLEVWGEVPAGHAIVGLVIGQGQTEDFRYLQILSKKLELTSSGLQTTGGTYSSIFGKAAFPYFDVRYSLGESSTKSVLVGLGLRTKDGDEHPDHTTTMLLQYGRLP